MNYTQLINFIQEKGLQNIVWATDLDGTMLEFQPRPADVKAPENLVSNFQKLNDLTDGRFYVISGRDLPFIDATLAPFKANVSAEHHCLLRFEGQEPQLLVEQPEWQKIELNDVSSLDPNVSIEHKTFTKTFHFRDVDAQNQQKIAKKLEEIAYSLTNNYNIQVGKPHLGVKLGSFAIEIGPHEQDKGEAVDIIMQQAKNAAREIDSARSRSSADRY